MQEHGRIHRVSCEKTYINVIQKALDFALLLISFTAINEH